ncbi:MAG: peptide-methionine (S)-S-oxide reductase MsrA [Candidatus Saccharimonadales bacterium]
MSETATIGGGCYWCLEAFYKEILGIESIVSGYSGGHLENPTTNQVYAGNTGHIEVVQLVFDPAIISYSEILEIFFVMHDPTTLNRQGYDIGEWYGSVIFYHDEAQHSVADEMIKNFAATKWDAPVVTRIEPFKKFWPADLSQQDYYENHPEAAYCQVIISPKIIKLRKEFTNKLRASQP